MKIKKLEWDGNTILYSKKALNIAYRVSPNWKNLDEYYWGVVGFDDRELCSSLEKAKQACQDHFETEIKKWVSE